MLLVVIDRFCRATRTTVQSHVRQGTVTLLGTGAAELNYIGPRWAMAPAIFAILQRIDVMIFIYVYYMLMMKLYNSHYNTP